jgi:diaminopimelate epimerase
MLPLVFGGKPLSVYRFDGITHIIAEDMGADETAFFDIKRLFEEREGKPCGAVGVMFYSTAKEFMRPAVYVYGTDTLVFESSCGSGSAALACHLTERGSFKTAVSIRQPGGTITATVTARDGAVERVMIGGHVSLSEMRFRLEL